ncbi:N-acetylmuramoyl-L-alanine amidase family protein [Taibaiella soli]|uniref:N-acetylmuramoyl-L-alanine amidase n=1 Tax=Taibaiella soli TaxID=1649169 RepID=A0A2W2BLK9_9BACT|nr:N-acetylmuramoyl-L-alanine amidase [Taibaiella soli]PZF74316.1 hypothetical protein DN068_04725 [Taibaiella soli]
MFKKILAASLIGFTTLTSFTPAKQKIRLVIDASHGNDKTGTVSKDDQWESMLALQFAQALEKVAKNHGMEVVMERVSDGAYKTMGDRAPMPIPSEDRKTYFISFHVNNSEKDKNLRGAELKYDATNHFAEESAILAKNIKKNMAPFADPKVDNKENLMVLHNNTVPAVAVIPGYMSNTEEMKRMKDPTFQTKLANAIVTSIEE